MIGWGVSWLKPRDGDNRTGDKVMSIKPSRTLSGLAVLGVIAGAPPAQAGSPSGTILEPLGSHREQTAEPSACCRNISEIGAYDPLTRRLFVLNYADNAVDICDIRDPRSGTPPHPSRAEGGGFPPLRRQPSVREGVRIGADPTDSDAISYAAGDPGPGGLLFIPRRYRPNLRPLLVVNYETSGSTRIYRIDRVLPHP